MVALHMRVLHSLATLDQVRDTRDLLTFMSGIFDHFRHHGLHDSDIAVQRTTNKSCKQRNPVRLGHTKENTRHCDTKQTNESNRLPAVNVRDHTPPRGGNCLRNGIRRNQQSSVERSISFMNPQVLYHHVRVREDGVEGEWLGKSAYSWPQVSNRSNHNDIRITEPHAPMMMSCFVGNGASFGYYD
jgi:hypothetical protein